jgi:hypothetical protein
MTTNGKKEKTNGKAVEKTNGKTNGQNVKVAQEEKIIPREAWTEFNKFWSETEWKDLTVADIKKHLGKYLFVPIPKDVTDKTIGQAWFDEIKQFKEKGKVGLKYRLNFSNDESLLRDLMGLDDLKISDAMKKCREYIEKHIVPCP